MGWWLGVLSERHAFLRFWGHTLCVYQPLRVTKRSSQPLAAPMTSSQHVYEIRARKDHRGVNLISDALPFGRAFALARFAFWIPTGKLERTIAFDEADRKL